MNYIICKIRKKDRRFVFTVPNKEQTPLTKLDKAVAYIIRSVL